MTCDIKKEKLIDFVYGEMSEAQDNEIQKHVQLCESCQTEIAELNQMRDTLGIWSDVEPAFQFTFVETLSVKNVWLQRIKSLIWNSRVAWAIPVAAVLLLFALNSRMVYQDGAVSIYFGQHDRGLAESEAVTVSQVQAMQMKTLQMAKQMIYVSESRQSQHVAGQLTRFAELMEIQRQRDLMLVGDELEGLHVNSVSQYQQTNAILSDLMQMASFQDTL